MAQIDADKRQDIGGQPALTSCIFAKTNMCLSFVSLCLCVRYFHPLPLTVFQNST